MESCMGKDVFLKAAIFSLMMIISIIIAFNLASHWYQCTEMNSDCIRYDCNCSYIKS